RRAGLTAAVSAWFTLTAYGDSISTARLIHWGFVCSALPRAPKRALSLGSLESPIIPAMLALEYDVTAIGSADAPTSLTAGVRLLSGDFRRLNPGVGYQVIVAGPAIEIPSIFGMERDGEPDADLKSMHAIARLMDRNGL